MYRRVRRELRSLSRHHYTTIFFTILLPAIGPPVVASFSPGGWVLEIGFYGLAFGVWSLIAVLAVASMLKKDRAETEQLVAHRTEDLAGQVSSLWQEHGNLKINLGQEIDNLEETVRLTLKERLDADLPPRRLSRRADPVGWNIHVEEPRVTSVRESWIARLRDSFQRIGRWVWKVVYGSPEHR